MTIAFGPNKIEPTPATVLFFEGKCMLDLAKLEGGKLIVLVTAAMVGAEDVKRFLIATSRNKPSYVESCQLKPSISCRRSEDVLTRTFRDPPSQSNRYQRREDLDK